MHLYPKDVAESLDGHAVLRFATPTVTHPPAMRPASSSTEGTPQLPRKLRRHDGPLPIALLVTRAGLLLNIQYPISDIEY